MGCWTLAALVVSILRSRDVSWRMGHLVPTKGVLKCIHSLSILPHRCRVAERLVFVCSSHWVKGGIHLDRLPVHYRDTQEKKTTHTRTHTYHTTHVQGDSIQKEARLGFEPKTFFLQDNSGTSCWVCSLENIMNLNYIKLYRRFEPSVIINEITN